MKSQTIFFFLVVCFLARMTVVAQPRLWEIYSTSNQPFVNVIIDKYQSDSLYVKFMDQSIVLHQDSIRYILRRNSSKAGIGFLVGAVAGGLFAAEASRGSSHDLFSQLGRGETVTAGIVFGGILGGIIGAGAGTDTRYQIDKLNSEEKRKLLVKLFTGD
jgi:hypothetical protein